MAAGSNIRQLAWKRRLIAIQYWISAAVLVALPFLGNNLLQKFAPIAKVKLTTPLWVYLLCFSAAALLVWGGLHLWKRAKHADQGAASESAVADVLNPLKASAWTVEYGFRDPRVGDIDVYLIAPSGKAYTLDVKSHGGLVKSSKGKLYRQYGQQPPQPFEKDFLEQAKKQALVLKDRQKLKHVTPAIVFSKAGVSVANPVNGVYVWKSSNVVAQLQKLESA
jgi:hypothetical protein